MAVGAKTSETGYDPIVRVLIMAPANYDQDSSTPKPDVDLRDQ